MHQDIKDCEVGTRADVRVYKFGEEHFQLNSYNKMRVFLAMHVLSQTIMRIIKDCCKFEGDEVTEE